MQDRSGMIASRLWGEPSSWRSLWRQLSSLCLIALGLLWLSWFTQEPHRYVHLIFPVILYFGLLALFNSYGAFACLAAFVYLLHLVNQKKIQATTEPVLALDLIQFRQAAALTSYIDIKMMLAPALLALALAWALLSQRSKLRAGFRLAFAAPLLLVILMQTGWIPRIAAPIKSFLRDQLMVQYVTWDLPGNLRLNGLLGHLWFTAEVSAPPRRGDGVVPFYQNVGPMMAPSYVPSRPLDVYLILCEACWAEEGKLKGTPLNHLLQRGFQPATVYSPEFGGNTANAEFEMLTGLPARGLSGVVYMNYGRSMRQNTASLPNELKAQGFKTYALHNFTHSFWNRNVVYPKLGFEKQVFIEQMPWDGKRWPDDRLLFDAAWQQVQEKAAANRFFFLITVHTHGSFDESENRGYGDYDRRLSQSMKQMTEFIDKIKSHNRAEHRHALFVVFGDHKPSLLKWFYDEGVLEKDLFSHAGATTDEFKLIAELTPLQRRSLHSVPLLVGSDDPALEVSQLARRMQQKPFYCVSAELAAMALRKPSDFYLAAGRFCNSPQKEKMLFTEQLFEQSLFAPIVYADRLFE